MVSPSLSSPASSTDLQDMSTSPVIADHTYSKITQLVPDTAEPPVTTSERERRPSGCINGQNVSSEHETHSMATDINEMFCDLDNLDFSLSDFDMDTDPDTTFSFQDYITDSTDSTFNFSDLCTLSSGSGYQQNSDGASSGQTCSSPRQFPHSCDSGIANILSPRHISAEGCVLSPSKTTTSTNASSNTKISQTDSLSCGPSIPTKMCSCLRSETEEIPACFYSSCQRDSTTVSSSTVTSYQREGNSGMTLKPGDYLPPLYIDTQCHEVSSPASSKSDIFSVADNIGTISKDGSRDAILRFPLTSSIMCNNDHHHNKTDALSPLATSASQKDTSFNFPQKRPGFQQLVDHCFTETSSNDDKNETVEELDLESISDLERYLTDAGLDLRSSEVPSLVSNSPFSLKKNDTVEEEDHSRTHSEVPSLSGLRLSILQNDELMLGFRDYSSVRKDSAYSPSEYHSQCQHPAKQETLSWLEKPAHGLFSTPTSSATSSPCPSPAFQGSQASSGSQMEWSSKEELSILDLFSDENVHFFLNSDSAICQMSESQFL